MFKSGFKLFIASLLTLVLAFGSNVSLALAQSECKDLTLEPGNYEIVEFPDISSLEVFFDNSLSESGAEVGLLEMGTCNKKVDLAPSQLDKVIYDNCGTISDGVLISSKDNKDSVEVILCYE